MGSLVLRQETTHKTDFSIKRSGGIGEPCFKAGDRMANFAVKVSGRLGEPCFQAGVSEANFAIKGSGRLGVERLSLVSRQETARPTLQ